MIIIEFLKVIIYTIIEFIKCLFSLWPVYDQLSGLKTEIIAAAIGVPAIVLTIVGIVFSLVKHFAKQR